jgi:hypothetical protein
MDNCEEFSESPRPTRAFLRANAATAHELFLPNPKQTARGADCAPPQPIFRELCWLTSDLVACLPTGIRVAWEAMRAGFFEEGLR